VTVTDKGGQYVPGPAPFRNFTILERWENKVPLESNFKFSVFHEICPSGHSWVCAAGTHPEVWKVAFSLARSAAIRFLDRLRDEDVAAVYKFRFEGGGRWQEFSGGRDFGPPMAFGVKAAGLTNSQRCDCLMRQRRLASRPEKRKRKAIVVLSDGPGYISAKASADKAR